MTKVYHATTAPLYERMKMAGKIKSIFRYWYDIELAKVWMRSVGYNVLVELEEPRASCSIPLDKRARWSEDDVYIWRLLIHPELKTQENSAK